jgi:hypothetical protein
MNRFAGVLGRQVESLLQALRKQQQERSREIIAAAEHRTKQALEQSRSRLRKRMRRAVSEERERRRHELHVAASRIETGVRERAYARYESILRDAWPRLVAALDNRWADAECRRAWSEMIAAEAAATMGRKRWLIEHPDSWPAAERDALTAFVTGRGISEPEFRADPDIRAGLRVRAGPACLDGSTAGLLSDRTEAEALLLAMWEQQGSMEPADD